MDFITKTDFERLSREIHPHCVSILMPTHYYGKEVNTLDDRILFKKKLKDVSNQLLDYQLSESQIKTYLKPAEDLLDNISFWRELSSGLAVYLHDDIFEVYKLPIDFEVYSYISNHFYLSPLLTYFSQNSNYYILSLSKKTCKLYDCSRYEINEVDTRGILPEKIEDVVGYDFKEDYLGFRTSSGSYSPGSKMAIRGYSEVIDNDKIETEKFLRIIHNGLVKHIQNQNVLLVLACDETDYSIFKEISQYKMLYPEYINGNVDNDNISLLHSKANSLIDSYFKQSMEERKLFFNEAIEKSTSMFDEIVSGAVNGKIETLFVEKNKHIYGKFDMLKDKIEIHDQKKVNNVCLINLAATETYMKGGKVFILKKEELPITESSLNAILRY